MEQTNWKRNIIFYLSGQTISIFGSALVQFAIIWYITLETKSGTMMMISTLCGFLPQLLITLFGGVWADRYDRKKMIVLADLSIAAATLVLALFFLSGLKEMWMLFLASAIRSFGSGVQQPASSALVTQIVPKDQLMRVNGLNGTIMSVIQLIAPMVGGAVLSQVSIEYLFFVDVVTAVIGVGLLLIIKVAPHERALSDVSTSAMHDLAEGLRYARDHYFLKDIYIFFALFFVLIVPSAMLTPLHVTRVFGGSYTQLTAIEVSFSAGAVIGGIAISVIGGFKNRVYTICTAGFSFGINTLLLGFINVFWLYCIPMVLMGFGLPFFNTPTTTLVQENVEPEKLGRVFSYFGIVSSSAFPLGMMIFGPLADVVKIDYLLIGTGLLLVLLMFRMITDKKLVNLKTEVKKELAEG